VKAVKILVVDDDRAILTTVRRNLEVRGYVVLSATRGGEALRQLAAEEVDLVILDLMLPDIDGLDVLRRMRQMSETPPVIVLSAKVEGPTKVEALDSGADDYLTKPFDMEELLARVRAVLRRESSRGLRQPALRPFEHGGLKIDFAAREVTVDGREVRLTPTEFRLLTQLVANAGKVMTHGMLLHRVWGPEYKDETEYLRVYINRLRRKLGDDPAKPRYILTEPAVGYRFARPT
jgi:two-component system KDP operon response regulator KdpE